MLSLDNIKNKSLRDWVGQVVKLVKPGNVVLCDGSDEEYNTLIKQMLEKGTLLKLNQKEYPNCYLNRSNPNDVARTEGRTFIVTKEKDDAGPMNNWMSPKESENVRKLFEGCMNGRTIYIVPYLMGPSGSTYSQVGIEITDSPYVVVNMKIMTRMGKIALEHLGDSDEFVKGLHSTADLDPENRYILQFPEERLIMSINSEYGGNALLSKKCHALRIASAVAKDEGWLAEHMLILEIEDPEGKLSYIAAAFPSASGKTNLAMINPPESYKGWKARIIGDDIAWLHLDKAGKLWAINPENGFFGVASGTSMKTNPNAMLTIKKNTIFTNVALTAEGTPWWEGMDDKHSDVIDWTGKTCNPKEKKCAHPNSRFTTPLSQYSHLSSHVEDLKGVPISAILFGGRRTKLIPLVYQSFNWIHGVFLGATMSVKMTAAAEGEVGKLRYDPMAMRPFCGYNMADYFKHWISFASKSKNLPEIFYVNWFRKDNDGKFLWPGFSENMRVIKWVLERAEGKGETKDTAIGYMPTTDSLDLNGLDLKPEVIEELLNVDNKSWLEETKSMEEFFKIFGDRLPNELWKEHKELVERLQKVG